MGRKARPPLDPLLDRSWISSVRFRILARSRLGAGEGYQEGAQGAEAVLRWARLVLHVRSLVMVIGELVKWSNLKIWSKNVCTCKCGLTSQGILCSMVDIWIPKLSAMSGNPSVMSEILSFSSL